MPVGEVELVLPVENRDSNTKILILIITLLFLGALYATLLGKGSAEK